MAESHRPNQFFTAALAMVLVGVGFTARPIPVRQFPILGSLNGNGSFQTNSFNRLTNKETPQTPLPSSVRKNERQSKGIRELIRLLPRNVISLDDDQY